MNEWDLDAGGGQDSRPIGTQFEKFILENCEWLIYLRKDHRFKCPIHWSQASESTTSLDVTCDTCWGFGEKTSANIVPARISRGRSSQVDPGGGSILDAPGYLPVFRDVAHFPRAVAPQLNDVLLLCEWNVPTYRIPKVRARPIRIHSIYLIKEINAQFLRQLSFFSCGLESFEVDKNQMEELLVSRLANLSALDVTTSWQNSYWSA